MGDWFATVALLGLALEVTGSSAVASLILVLQSGPFFLVSPVAGMLADRFDRRRLLIGADVARMFVCFGFLLANDAATLWLALLCVSLLSVGAAVFEPTAAASLPNLVDDADLAAANTLNSAAWGTMAAVGAAIGGLVAAALGRDAAYLLDALSFALSALLISRVHRDFRARRADGSHAEGAPLGLRGLRVAASETRALARGSRTIAALLVTKTTFGAGMGVLALLAVFGRQVFQAGDVGIGVLFAARGLGALVGPFVARAAAGDDDRGLIRGVSWAVVAFIVGYALLPLSPGLALASACVFVAHMGGGAQWFLSSFGLQRAVPDALRGRVLGFDYASVTMATTISTIVAGLLAATLGPNTALYVMIGIVGVTGGLWLLWTRPLRAATPPARTAVLPTTLDG